MLASTTPCRHLVHSSREAQTGFQPVDLRQTSDPFVVKQRETTGKSVNGVQSPRAGSYHANHRMDTNRACATSLVLAPFGVRLSTTVDLLRKAAG